MPWLLRAEPWDEAAAAVRPLYFSDVGFTTGPAESPAHTYWDRRIQTPLVVRQSLFGGAASSGRSEISLGSVTLANDDGALDDLAALDWDGRFVELRFTPRARPVLADFAVMFSGTAERLVPGDTLEIELRDLQLLLDEPYQVATFAGTGGVEGPAAYKGRRKPRLLGTQRQFVPLLLDEANQVYCIGDGPIGAVLEVRDRGVVLPLDADYASYAALVAAAIPAGKVATCLALGLFRLNGAVAGPLTVDARGAAPGGTALGRFADLVQHVVDTDTSLGPADFAAGTVAACNALAGQTLGHWYDGAGETTVRGVLDQLADSVGCFYGFDDARKLVLGRLDAPAATPDFAFTARDLLSLRPLPVARRLKKQVVAWGRRLRPLGEGEIAGSVTDKTLLMEEWRLEEDASAAVAAASLLSREERLESRFDTAADALAEAQRRVALHGPRRAAFEAVVPFVAGLRPGMTVRLTDPRFGLAGGRSFRAMRVDRDAAAETVTMELWG